MDNKKKYEKLCLQESSIPIFSQKWWLDSMVENEKWDVALVEQNNEIIASLPYAIKGKFGIDLITMPKLTQTLGPWIRYPEGQKYSNRLSFEKRVMSELINQLPKFGHFSQNFNYKYSNWLPFYWKGFKQTTRYTYVIEDISNQDEVYRNFSKNLRSRIRKTEKMVEVSKGLSIETFYEINKMTFDRQSMDMPYSFEYIKGIDKSCAKNNAREIFYATYKDKVVTAIYVIWNQDSAYLLMSGSDPKYRNLNAKNLLVWEAIKYLSDKTKKFDFEGSMVENIAEYNRAFGGIQVPYFNISKTNSKLYKLRMLFSDIRNI